MANEDRVRKGDRTPEGTIGSDWPADPAERVRVVESQEALVSGMARLAELLDDYQLGDL